MKLAPRSVLGYATVFAAGFCACALALKLSSRPAVIDVSPLPSGRAALADALAQPPHAGPAPQITGPSIADAAARVSPAVVNIEAAGVRTGDNARDPFRGGADGAPFSMPEGSGSGILLSADGYILTNNHVIATAGDNGEIVATLADGRRFRAIKIGADRMSDLAVLKIPGGRDLPSAQLGDSEKVRVGDWAIAVGNPLGFTSSVTAGIVSALNRDYYRRDNYVIDRVIQTDAPINPGNSGGALADVSGRVIGINTALASSTGASVGIGFAIPINAARQIAAQLIRDGRVIRPYIGIIYAPLQTLERDATPSWVRLPDDNLGAVIPPPPDGGVAPGSPAARAGLAPWDVIRAVDGRPVKGDDDIRDAVRAHQIGDSLTFTVWRAGETFDAKITLEPMPDTFGSRP